MRIIEARMPEYNFAPSQFVVEPPVFDLNEAANAKTLGTALRKEFVGNSDDFNRLQLAISLSL